MEQIIIVKDFLVALSIIFLMKNPYWQLIPTILIYLAFIILLIKYRSFSSKLYFATMMVNEVVYTFILCCYFVFNATKHNMSPDERRKYFGWGLIIVCGLNILFNLCVGFYELFVAIKDCCCKKPNQLISAAERGDLKIRAKQNSQSDESLLNLNQDSPDRKIPKRNKVQQALPQGKKQVQVKKKVKEDVERSLSIKPDQVKDQSPEVKLREEKFRKKGAKRRVKFE